jgi:hypothetical protein
VSQSGRNGSAFRVAQEELAARASLIERSVCVVDQLGFLFRVIDGKLDITIRCIATQPDSNTPAHVKRAQLAQNARRARARLAKLGAPEAPLALTASG